jgi:rhodanese-related sulfurtransferase
MQSIIFSKKVYLFFISFFILATQTIKAQENKSQKIDKIEQITPKQAIQLLENNNALMIDVREIEELEILSYNVDSIINIPLSNFEIEFENKSFNIIKNRKIILVCRSGKRSQRVAKFLLKKGYSSVYNLRGGIIEWEKQKMKVKRGN